MSQKSLPTFLDMGPIVAGPFDTLNAALEAANDGDFVYATRGVIDSTPAQVKQSHHAFDPCTSVEYTVLGCLGTFAQLRVSLVSDAFLAQSKLRDAGFYIANRRG